MNRILPVLFWLCGFVACAQNPLPTSKFPEAAAAYFKADREKIHLHLNKTVLQAGEKLWFKGYLTEIKNNLPYGATTNVHVQLKDTQGKVRYQLLAYAEGSVFTGFIPLKGLEGGLYHVHAYTNFMNNFAEDESAMATISVIGEADGKFYDMAKLGDEMEISFHPEGGALVDGIANTVGVHIRDCNGNGIAIQDGVVTDAAGKTITTFSTSDSGYGRFDIPSATTQQYSATVNRNGAAMTSKLPLAQTAGVTLSANSYANPQKTVIRLRTNPRGAKSGPYGLYVQQAALASGSAIDLSTGEQTLAIPTSELPYGICTLFVTDQAGKPVARRLFFNPVPGAEPSIDFAARRQGDSVIVHGVSTIRNGELSISVLPSRTLADKKMPDMATSLWADAFVESSIGNINTLVADYSRKNGYELDNRLICSAPKYTWENINGPVPGNKHPFDIGLTVKGTINSTIRDKASAKVTMNSYQLGLNETVPVNDRNEVIFENIMAVDSTHIHFSLFEKNEKMAKMQMAFSVNNAARQFIKPFTARSCTTAQMAQPMPVPKIDGAIELADVVVEAEEKKEEKLTKLVRYNNNWARGYKITDNEFNMYRDVLSFIQNHGYNVERTGGTVIIRSRISRSFVGSLSPAIFMDDVPLTDYNILDGMGLNQIDEIYINKHGYGGGDNSSNGIIRIYTRKDLGAKAAALKVKSQSFLIEKGFQQYDEFTMPRYDSFEDPGFQALGAIHWLPRVGTNENGSFAFALPHTGLEEVKLIVRGISSEGVPISITKVIKLP